MELNKNIGVKGIWNNKSKRATVGEIDRVARRWRTTRADMRIVVSACTLGEHARRKSQLPARVSSVASRRPTRARASASASVRVHSRDRSEESIRARRVSLATSRRAPPRIVRLLAVDRVRHRTPPPSSARHVEPRDCSCGRSAFAPSARPPFPRTSGRASAHAPATVAAARHMAKAKKTQQKKRGGRRCRALPFDARDESRHGQALADPRRRPHSAKIEPENLSAEDLAEFERRAKEYSRRRGTLVVRC